MYRRTSICVVLFLGCIAALADYAHAWPPRRRVSYSAGSTQVAPKVDEASSEYRPLQVDYNYDRGSAREVAFLDRLRVFLQIRDEQVLKVKEPLVAEVRVTDMTDSEAPYVAWCPVSLSRDKKEDFTLGVLEVVNARRPHVLRPANVYRLFVNLHRQSAKYGKDTVLGRVPLPYYVATSGRTRLQQARHHIAMRTFKEWYFTERGWPSQENYVMDCHAYYIWATGSCTVGAQYGRANLGALFGGNTPYRSGGDIPELMKKGPIHGDYVRVPGHTFMLLAYDAKRDIVWTMEGNFGRSIEVAIRTVGGGWTVGHLEEEHIQPDMFKTALSDAEAVDRLARNGSRRDAGRLE